MSGTSWMFPQRQRGKGEGQGGEARRKRRKHRASADGAAPAAAAAAAAAQRPDDVLSFLTRLNPAAPPAKRAAARRPAAAASSDEPLSSDEGSGGDARGAGGAPKPLAYAAVGALSVYYGIKGILGGYQQLRRRNLRHLLRTVAPALDALGVTYWVDFGSLLGAHREGDVIIHDNDADVVVLNPDWDVLLADLRAALPQFRVFFVVPSEDRSVRWIRLLSGVGVMDVYGAYDGDAAAPGMISIPQGHGDLCDIPASLVLPLGASKFRGVPISVPGDVHGTLVHRYGPDYMVPRYMDKGRDVVEAGKAYARLLRLLSRAGFRV
ncbi:MAG: hypothetical protein J3K34DRAFT_525710 [Monoraphidium minutum]|nr:MAG: hypothetical protein J3K34DRAFT_525710 [Monoraphidium minutum]